jgi:hypothetical protein
MSYKRQIKSKKKKCKNIKTSIRNNNKNLKKRNTVSKKKYLGGANFLSNMIGNENQEYIATKNCDSEECCYGKKDNPFDIDQLYRDDMIEKKLLDKISCLLSEQEDLKFAAYLCRLKKDEKTILNFSDQKINKITGDYNLPKSSKCKIDNYLQEDKSQ